MTAELSSATNKTDVTSVLQLLAQNRKVALFVNCRWAKEALPDWLSESDDLFFEAPQEVREVYSLHAVGNRELDELWDLAEWVKDRDAGIWVFSDIHRDDLLKGLKLYLAWYARPSVLKTQLEQGSRELAKRLLSGVIAVLLQKPGDPMAYVFVNSERTESLDLSKLSSDEKVCLSVV